MYLLDTDVIWTLRRREAEASDALLFDWVANQIPGALFISAISMMEFENGTRLLERRDKPGATAIHKWLETRLRPAFDGRMIAIDDAIIRRWSHLGCPDFRDGILAATALEHGLILATSKTGSFRTAKVKTVNPWTYAPETDDLDWRRASRSAPIWLKSLFVRA